MNDDKTTFEQWAIVELLGHVRMAGRVTEEQLFGRAMGRIDIPGPGGDFLTQYFGGDSIYRLTPCSEAAARAVASANRPAPVSPYEIRQFALPAMESEEPADRDDLDEEYLYGQEY